MKKKMGIEGAGPKIFLYAIAYLIIAYFINGYHHQDYIISQKNIDPIIIYILLAIGVLLWLSSAVLIIINIPKGRLITSGPFAVFPNPLYSAFILFLLPALALYLNSWIFFGTSIVAYIAMKTVGQAEDQYLLDTFGAEYKKYKKRVLLKFL